MDVFFFRLIPAKKGKWLPSHHHPLATRPHLLRAEGVGGYPQAINVNKVKRHVISGDHFPSDYSDSHPNTLIVIINDVIVIIG
jgi:hypothetical protein